MSLTISSEAKLAIMSDAIKTERNRLERTGNTEAANALEELLGYPSSLVRLYNIFQEVIDERGLA
jgi:hypothetical protein